MDWKIEKGVPMPRTPLKYPFREMQVGDSFLVPFDDGDYHAARMRVHASAQRLGMNAVTKQEGNYIRVWRSK